MAETTVYNVLAKFSSSGINALRSSIRGIETASNGAAKGMGALNRLAAGFVAFKAFGMIKSALIDANSEVDQLQLGMSTMISMNLALPFERAEKVSGRLFSQFEEDAKKSTATTRDFIEMANGITGAVTGSGGSMSDVRDLTKGAVTASKAFGARADVASLDITQAVMGNASARDRFARMIIEPYMTLAEFNKKKDYERVEFLKKALNSPAIQAAAKKQGESFAGQVSTLKDNLEIALRKVGLPLMKAMSKELQKWNAWLDKHPKTIESIARKVGGFLKSVFTFVVDAARITADSLGTIVGFVGGGNVAGVGAFALLGAAAMGLLGPFAALAAAIAVVVAAVQAIKHPGKALGMIGKAGEWGAERVRGMFGRQDSSWLNNAMATAQAARFRQEAPGMAIEALRGIGSFARDIFGVDDMNFSRKKRNVAGGSAPKVNVTINKIEVTDDDPDRFVHQLVGTFARMAESPSQARSIGMGAF
jgi:hypothetical protein